MSPSRLGLIPCAGSAERFGGVPKELLPIAEGTLLGRCISVLEPCVDRFLFVISEAKLPVLVPHLPADALVAIQRDDRDLYGAMRCAFGLADVVMLSMPDTIWDNPPEPIGEFGMGTFRANKPERFGCLSDNGFVVDKNDAWAGTQRTAWGMLYWASNVEERWRDADLHIRNQTDAINFAIGSFGSHKHRIEGYRDFASWEDYRAFIRED